MAQTKIDIKFDIDSKAVKIAGEETMKLTTLARALKAELASGKYSQEEFEILSTKLGDVQDQMQKTTARSGDLFTSLQLIPGPIGEIASKFNGAIALLKTFASFSLADLGFQFRETVADVQEIIEFLGRATGITAAYTTLNNALTASFISLGIAQNTATIAARAFAAALVTTGVGALVVALGFAVNALMDFIDSSDEAAAAQERLAKQIADVNSLLEADLADAGRRQKLRIAELKRDGASEKQIRDQQLTDLKENLRLTQQALQENRALESQVLKTGEGELKDVYAQQAALEEKQAQLINDIRVAAINNETENNKEKESQRQKNIQSAQKAATEELRIEQEKQQSAQKAAAEQLRIEQEKQQKLKEAQEIQREAELSLLENQDREIQERINRFNIELTKLKEAGYTDFTALEEEFRIDLDAIDTRYNQERKAKEKQEANDAIIRTKQFQDANLAQLDAANQAEINRIEEKYGEFKRFDEAYYKSLRDEYARNEKALKEANDRKDISDAEYDKRITASSKARRELDILERDSAIQKTQLIGDAFGQLSTIVGQETVAGKAFAVAKATIDTYTSAVSAYNALVGIPVVGPALAAIAAGAAVASGIATVKKIVAVQVPNAPGGGGNLTQTTPSAPSEKPSAINVSAAPIKFAVGGLVRGPGTDTSDSIPAMLSDGEFVVNARSTRLFQPILSAINASADLPGFAMGGLVDKNRDRPARDNSDTIAEAINVAFRDQPIRTYVTAGEISNEQQFDRIIKSRSLI
jgi:hypothetical protein